MKTFDEITNKDFFYCYNPKLHKFLEQNGIDYFLKAKSVKDNKIFTMYKKSKKLSNCIAKYKELNNEIE